MSDQLPPNYIKTVLHSSYSIGVRILACLCLSFILITITPEKRIFTEIAICDW